MVSVQSGGLGSVELPSVYRSPFARHRHRSRGGSLLPMPWWASRRLISCPLDVRLSVKARLR